MIRPLFFSFLLFFTSLFPAEVDYGGIKFYCDEGCGDPDWNGYAYTINYLERTWLLAPTAYPRLDLKEDPRFGLTPWEGFTPWPWDTQPLAACLEDTFSHASAFTTPPTHSDFISSLSAFGQEADLLSFKIQAELDLLKQTIKDLRDIYYREGDLYDYKGDYDIDPYLHGPPYYQIPQVIEKVREDLKREREQVVCLQRYRDYTERVAEVIDSYYKKMFLWCLKNHQPEGLLFRASLESFLRGNIDQAFDQLRFLIELGEKQGWKNDLLAKLYHLNGEVENQLCLYSHAIVDLTTAIQKDPTFKEAYLERARAYFETGRFEEAFQDFLASGVKSTPLEPSLYEFGLGLMEGISEGATNSFSSFLPELLNSLKTLGSGMWALAQHPVQVSSEFARAANEVLVTFQDARQTLEIFVPELAYLVKQWNRLSDFERGERAGQILGKYGTDIFLNLQVSSGINAFTKLRKAAMVQNLEAYGKSEKNAAQIAKAARDAQLKREAAQFLDGSLRLKNANLAKIDTKKITDYALKNPGKAKGFREVLGYNESNWEDLVHQIKDGVKKGEAKFHCIDRNGAKFTVDIPVAGPNRTANIRTGWIYDPGSETPRLTTLFLHETS